MPSIGTAYPYNEAYDVLKSGLFSDFIIRCKDCTFRTHRLVLHSKSGFFRAALTNNFKEQKEGILDLSEYQPETVATMIIYCYTNELHAPEALMPWSDYFTTIPKISEQGDSIKPRFCHLLDVYNLAGYLLLDDLKYKVGTRIFEKFETLSQPSITKRFLEQTVLPVMQYAYEVLPESDANLRPVLTSWIVWMSRLQVFEEVPSLKQLAKDKDPSHFAAASFFKGKNAGALQKLQHIWAVVFEP